MEGLISPILWSPTGGDLSQGEQPLLLGDSKGLSSIPGWTDRRACCCSLIDLSIQISNARYQKGKAIRKSLVNYKDNLQPPIYLSIQHKWLVLVQLLSTKRRDGTESPKTSLSKESCLSLLHKLNNFLFSQRQHLQTLFLSHIAIGQFPCSHYSHVKLLLSKHFGPE